MWCLAVIIESRRAILTLCICGWIFACCVQGGKYSMTEMCESQDGSVKISLDQGSYVQLDMTLDFEGPGTNCEIVIQTIHKDDGLLLYFENFDFAGTHLATVYRQDCGPSLLRIWDGEFRYLSSCVGEDLKNAPPMTIFSSLGAVKLQLLPANTTGSGNKLDHANSAKKSPINFTVIATASQKASVSDGCPSGCCRDPYNFRCPLLNYCIDVKLTCNNVTNCGPRVNLVKDENGLLCNNQLDPANVVRVLEPSDVQRVITMDDSEVIFRNGDMLRPVWSHDPGSTFGDVGNTEVPQSFYTRVELVCGIISIALFCLAGLGVVVCKARASSRFRNFSGSVPDSAQTTQVSNTTNNANQTTVTLESESAADGGTGDRPQTERIIRNSSGIISIFVPSGSSNTSDIVLPNRTTRCECCGLGGPTADGVYAIDILGVVHRPNCPNMELVPPPSYESLYPKDRTSQDT